MRTSSDMTLELKSSEATSQLDDVVDEDGGFSVVCSLSVFIPSELCLLVSHHLSILPTSFVLSSDFPEKLKYVNKAKEVQIEM